MAVLGIVLSTVLSSAAQAGDKGYTSEKQRFSYAIGIQLGSSLKQQGITDIDVKAMTQAIDDMLKGNKLQVSPEDMQKALNAYKEKLVAENKLKAKQAAEAGSKFRQENKKKKGVTETKSGIQYEILKKGDGKKPKVTDTVTVHYEGTLVSGKVFDSSIKRGSPATFPLNGVIKGWQEVLPLMPIGSKWKVVIPPQLAYGDRGAGGSIGPGETLVFEIELISIK